MIVKELPKINLNVGDIENALSEIKNFYSSLGWDESTEVLNPTKIKVSRKDYDKMAEDFTANGKDNDERTRLALIWMNYGPSVSTTVKVGMIHIHNGFTEKG